MFLGQFQSSQCDESNLGCTFYRSDHLMAEYGTLERNDSVPGTTMIQRDNNHRPASMRMRQGLPRAGYRTSLDSY